MASVSEILNAAADLLEKPGSWTQGQHAKRADGGFCFATEPEASCWCLFGAISKACAEAGKDDTFPVDEAFRRGTGIETPATWNDDPSRTQAEVVAALRAAATHQTGEPG